MSLRNALGNWQVQWAERNGIAVGAPPGNPASAAMGYVNELDRNLLEPLSGCVNCFHYWSQLLNDAPGLNSKPAINALLTACGLPASPAKSIDFEVPNIVNPHIKVAPHLDVQISIDWTLDVPQMAAR